MTRSEPRTIAVSEESAVTDSDPESFAKEHEVVTVRVEIAPRVDRSADTTVRRVIREELVRKFGFHAAQDRGVAAGGLLLSFYVEPPLYESGSLVLRLHMRLCRRGDEALLGEFSPKLTMADVRARDADAERELVALAARNVIGTFMKVRAEVAGASVGGDFECSRPWTAESVGGDPLTSRRVPR